MKKFKSLVLAVIGLLCSMSVSAEDFVVDGFFFDITSQAKFTVEISHIAKQGEIIIPSKVTYFGEEYSVTSIGQQACINNNKITSITIPNGVTNIGDRAFFQCSQLTSIHIGNDVKNIGLGAFQFCKELKNIVIPKGVMTIGLGAFSGCDKLETIIVDKDNTIYDSRKNCNAIIETSTNIMVVGCKNSSFPHSVTHIGNYAFAHNTSIKDLTIPDNIIGIGEHSFAYCEALETISIGNNVTEIEKWGFYGCYKLTKLISYAEVPPTCGTMAFEGIDKETCVLQVPESSLAAYQQADQWKEFFFIEDVLTAIGGVTVDGAVSATADVYSTNGMLIKRNAELKNLKHELPAGIYIIGGKKVLVK